MVKCVSEAWDREYVAGRYHDADPQSFVADILSAAASADLVGAEALYVGCGNGRNLIPLVDGGLDVVGLDVSAEAIAQLSARNPNRADRLVVGTVDALPPDRAFPVVVGIQVFQHGDRATAHAHVQAAQERTARGGLFCIRVNATATDVWPAHVLTERHEDGGFSVRYLEGSKSGLDIHFFSKDELTTLFAHEFEAVLPLRLDSTRRSHPEPGQWSQWEGIWMRAPSG